MRVLRICNSADLPPYVERDDNYIYFTYDNMEIYIGQNRFYDHYCIVDRIPEHPAQHMLFITMDGDVKVCMDNTIKDVASIEDPSQKQYLLEAGSVFFMKAEYRYLDLQTRTIQLPYQNGTYMLSTSMANDIMIDNDTVISYDETKGHFVIDGNLENSEELRRISQYKSSETDTAKTTIKDGRILTDAKISNMYYNIIQIAPDGIYADTSGLATSDEVHLLANTYYNFKKEMLYYINEIREALEGIDTISEETLNAKILAALENYNPNVQDIIDNYEIMYQQLGILTQTIEDYADERYDEIYQQILDYFTDMKIDWEPFIIDEQESDPETAYTESEIEVRNMIMAEFNKQVLALRERQGDFEGSLLYSLVLDEGGFEDTSSTNPLNTLTITSTPGEEYKYTALTVSPEKESDTHRYFYAVDIETYPIANEKLNLTVYTEWNGEDELEVEYGKTIIIVETNTFRRTLKYGTVISNANRG